MGGSFNYFLASVHQLALCQTMLHWRHLFQRKYLRLAFRCTLAIACIGCFAMYVAKLQIDKHARGLTYTDIDSIPKRKVALVLGCARHLADGRENLYFRYRMEAAAELYHAGKVEHILVSGDNSRVSYDESTDMMDALMAKGVHADHIVRDFAGFSTLDSVVRAKEVFLEEQCIVVSQAFHVKRAIYIGAAHDMDVIGYCAQDVSARAGFKTNLRECLARFKTILDVHILGREPKFYGDTIAIGSVIAP